MTPKQEAWAIQAEHVIKQMERRHFNAYYCSTNPREAYGGDPAGNG